MGFNWVPGEGVCADRLNGMRVHRHKPLKPMGEAWFIGEDRRVFTELENDISNLPINLLQQILEEIGAGVASFGLLDEWSEWFDYLLPEIILRGHERYVSWLHEEICSAFLQIDLDGEGLHATEQHRDDVLHTLGKSIMQADHWFDGTIVLGKILHPTNNYPIRKWGWTNVSGDLAASMFLCLRLIKTEDIDGWVQSIFAIGCPYWRAQILTWFIGAKPLLEGKVFFPSQFDGWTPKIDWSGSHYINGEHGQVCVAHNAISDANLDKFKAASAEALATPDLGVWIEEILSVEALRSEVGSVIGRVKFL